MAKNFQINIGNNQADFRNVLQKKNTKKKKTKIWSNRKEEEEANLVVDNYEIPLNRISHSIYKVGRVENLKFFILNHIHIQQVVGCVGKKFCISIPGRYSGW